MERGEKNSLNKKFIWNEKDANRYYIGINIIILNPIHHRIYIYIYIYVRE